MQTTYLSTVLMLVLTLQPHTFLPSSAYSLEKNEGLSSSICRLRLDIRKHLTLSDSNLLRLAFQNDNYSSHDDENGYLGVCRLIIPTNSDKKCTAYLQTAVTQATTCKGSGSMAHRERTVIEPGAQHLCITTDRGALAWKAISMKFPPRQYQSDSSRNTNEKTGTWQQVATQALRRAIEADECEIEPIFDNRLTTPCQPNQTACFCFPTPARKHVPSSPMHANARASIKGLFPKTVTLDRLSHCTLPWPLCNSRQTRPDYKPFTTAGVSSSEQRAIYLTQIATPPLNETTAILLAIAGQQARDGDENTGSSSGVTGQPVNYASGFGDGRTASGRVKLGRRGLLEKVVRMDSGRVFGGGGSFIAAVFDARFNYEFWDSTKNRHEEGYFQYLESKIGPLTTVVYIAGHSRGGCLAMRLAKRLTEKYNKLKVIVHNFDGVCAYELRVLGVKVRSGEFGVKGDIQHKSPLVDGYQVYTTDTENQLTVRECLSVRTFLSGEGVIVSSVRAFGERCLAGGSGKKGVLLEKMTDKRRERVWYSQTWEKQTHFGIAFAHHRKAVQNVRQALANFPVSCVR